MRFAPLAVDSLILKVQKPSRYVGGEVNSIVKDLHAMRATWALCFPDTYEVGMSNLGFRVLYHVLNRRPDVACERAFMPWPDMEALQRQKKVPLWSIESRVPLKDFDILGFSLQFEACYPTVLAMLDLMGVPIFTAERDASHPVVLAGGPCTFNGEPMWPFFDAMIIGEGEEVVHELTDAVADWRESGGSRKELHWRLSEIPGVYVPSLFDMKYGDDGTIAAIVPLKPGYESIRRRVVPDLNLVPHPEKPVLPFMQTVHDRLPIEIQRGCTRGCRFCQVGMLTRPTRQRDPKQVLELAARGLANTGYEEVGFLSLSAGDYGCINPMLEDFFERFAPERIAISLPSLRTETMNDGLTAQISKVRKTGFTMAPEAASERMRRVINKGNEEKDLLTAVDSVFKAGWSLLKLYFMIGLPTERDEDVIAIAELGKKAYALAKKHIHHAAVNVSVSTFVPKPFTPFQWDRMLTLEETVEKHKLLRRNFPDKGGLALKYHEAHGTVMEGVLARGDRRAATAVLAAWKAGQRLDGWTEYFNYDVWMRAFGEMEKAHGVSAPFLANRERGEDEILPWDHIECEVTKPYLWKERVKSLTEGNVVDCALGPCTACGACDYDVVTTRVYKQDEYLREAPVEVKGVPEVTAEAAVPLVRTKLRVRYGKSGRTIAISHLETMQALVRAIRRAKLPVAYSNGYHPKPKIDFSPACPVGVESNAEFFDVELVGEHDPKAIADALAAQLPAGYALFDVTPVPAKGDPLAVQISEVHYRATFPSEVEPGKISSAIESFGAAESVEVLRAATGGNQKKGRGRGRGPAPAKAAPKRIELKRVVSRLEQEGPRQIRFTLKAGGEASAKPLEVMNALFGELDGVAMLKEGVTFLPPDRVPLKVIALARGPEA